MNDLVKFSHNLRSSEMKKLRDSLMDKEQWFTVMLPEPWEYAKKRLPEGELLVNISWEIKYLIASDKWVAWSIWRKRAMGCLSLQRGLSQVRSACMIIAKHRGLCGSCFPLCFTGLSHSKVNCCFTKEWNLIWLQKKKKNEWGCHKWQCQLFLPVIWILGSQPRDFEVESTSAG